MGLHHDVHLVGSIPLPSIEDVFKTVGRILGNRAPRIPDGEVDRPWLGWLEDVFAKHKDFVSAGEHHRVQGGEALRRYRLRDGARPENVKFDNLRHATVTKSSYRAFEKVKAAGIISERARFLTTIATPVAVMDRYIVPEQQLLVEPAYENALLDQVQQIEQTIPHDSLAIQWDVAREVISAAAPTETAWGHTREEIQNAHCERLCRLGRSVPASAELLYHLCYGDFEHRHAIEPSDTSILVDYANRIVEGVGRDVSLFHMPVPRDRSDDAYFEPLQELATGAKNKICLGLVHLTDGIEGSARRMATAGRYLSNYAIATECGFGRRSPDVVVELLKLHAALVDEHVC